MMKHPLPACGVHLVEEALTTSASHNSSEASEFSSVSCNLHRAEDRHVGHVELFGNCTLRFTRMYPGKDLSLLFWGELGWCMRRIAWPPSRTRQSANG